MNSVSALRSASGRSTRRSISTATTTIAAAATRNAAQNGTLCSVSVTKVSAASSTIAPCAKLKTPDAL